MTAVQLPASLAVEQTAACEASQHHRCTGAIVSLTAAHGMSCGCVCHGGGDLAIAAAIERQHDWLGYY
jgi:hypothetical protein